LQNSKLLLNSLKLWPGGCHNLSGPFRLMLFPPSQCVVTGGLRKMNLFFSQCSADNIRVMSARYLVLLGFFSAVLAFGPTPAVAVQSVSLSWDPSPSSDVAGYNIYYGSGSGNYTTVISVGNATDAQLSGFVEGVTYYFAVTAYGDSGQESELSNEVSYSVPGIAPPAAITSIQGSLPQQGVMVTWVASLSAGVVGYNVYYGTQSGYYTGQISVTGTNGGVIYGVEEGVTYFFVVTACDSSGQESVYSSEISYTVPTLEPPGSITSIQPQLAANVVTLTWDPSPSAGVAGYNVYYGPYDGYYPYEVSVPDANQATIYGLIDWVTYYFVVRAYGESGQESDPSSQASYTVPPLDPPGSITSIQPQLAANVVTLTWDPSPSAGVVGYKVCYGPYDGYYPCEVSVTDTNRATIYGLIDGVTYYFVVRAYDGSGQESDPSSQASYAVPPLDPPGAITSIRQTDQGVALSWVPSPGAAVMGYNIYYGPYSGYYIGVISVSGTNEATIYGLEAGKTYYFAVTAHDNSGQESVPSSEASYTLPAAAVPGPVLTLQPLPVAGFQNAFSITTADAVPSSWTLEASSDLQTWRTLTTGNDPSLNVTVVVATKPALFFRLDSSYSDIELQIQKDGTNGFPNAFSVFTPNAVPWWWTLEFSDDLQNWSALTTGCYSPVNLAVVTVPTPAMFFRLKGE
jgi:fibronectin type 3 domain-containing protein